MSKLLITRGAEFTGEEWIRFDIHSDDLNKNKWATVRVKTSDEMVPYQCFELEKKDIIQNLTSVIIVLKDYLEQIQMGE